MAIKSISEKEFSSYPMQKNPMANVLGEEVAWFEEKENNLIATIIKDKIDNDWAYVILVKYPNNEYRAEEVEASLETQEIAEKNAKRKINELIKAGEFREELYNDETITEDLQKNSLIITDINVEIKKYFKKYPEKLYELSSRKFEELVASILEDMGLNVELTKATRDGGTDIIAVMKNALTSMLIFVECKKYSPDFKVDVGIIREVTGVHALKQPEKSIIVTTSTFTKDAMKEAELARGKLELNDYENLREWLSNY
ncbi:restriction endonuclease [Flavobacterium sp.]|uniref:restriction endonuclease n=1 Tax=Flavobacterium sp. TaxID=239 RepID=UPI0031DACD69